MSALDTDPMDALASALNAIDPTANASAKTMGEAEMLARVHNVVVGGAVSHLTTPVGQLLAGIANALSNGPAVSHLTHSRTEMVAAMAGQSALTVSEGDLWASAMTAVAGYSGGGGGGGYSTGAVTFDGASSLLNATLVNSDAPHFSMSVWLRLTDYATLPVLFVVDPVNDYSNFFLIENDGTTQLQLANLDSSSSFRNDTTIMAQIPVDAWFNLIVSTTTNDAMTAVTKIYINGTDVTSGVPVETNYPLSPAFNGRPLYIGDDTFGDSINGSVADFWLAPGQSLIVGTDIPPSTISKFIAGGKPVDLGADGSTPTGVAPAVFLRRAPAAAATTFATNLGSGGDFTITGALTSAASSPSD